MALLLGIMIVLVAAATVVVVRVLRRERAARRDLDKRLEQVARRHASVLRRRSIERELESGLELAETQSEVVELARRAVLAIDDQRPVELHLLDPHEPMLRLAFATGATPRGQRNISSPWDSVAARDGVTLVYATTDVDDVCPHLRERLIEHCSAIGVPLLATGRIVGLLYAFGPIDREPSTHLVESYESIARATATHIATVRAFGRDAPTDAHPDDLDGSVDFVDVTTWVDEDDRSAESALVSNEDAAMEALEALIERDVALCVLLFDIDELGRYHAHQGPAASDLALRLVTSLAAREIADVGRLFRLEGDRFMVILGEGGARQALLVTERIRAVLGHELRQRSIAPFTLSIGVVEAGRDTSADRLLQAATDALHNAKARGHNRAVLGIDVALATR